MSILLRVVVLCAASSVLGCASHAKKPATEGQDAPVTQSAAGIFRGSWMETRRGRRFQAYRGIRYAEPPVGELRFQPPKDIITYRDEVDASKEGPACPLPAPPTYYVDEDCLTINVYTPNNKVNKPLPVIFFIHPGGFYSMTGRSDLVGPHYFLDKDVVLVGINYRLGSLGFMSTGDSFAPGNNGMKDQVSALRWVQRNICSFGGDPNQVTIAGVSAGSISVMLHMISPMAKGLFHRGVSMSGSATKLEPTPTHQKFLAVRQAEILNCPTNSSKEIYDCLMKKPWKELGDSLPRFFEYGGDPVGLWGPVVEPDFGQERYLDIEPIDAIKQGKMHAVPHIISQTEAEFYWFAFNIMNNDTLITRFNEDWETVARLSFLLPQDTSSATLQRLREFYFKGKPLKNDSDSTQALGTLYSDSITGFPVNRMAKLMAKYSPHPVWYYELAYVGNHSYYEDPETNKPIAAMHHDDMIYLLSQSYRFPSIPPTSPDSQMVDKMIAIFYNFARYGDPNPKGDTPELGSLNWPKMTLSEANYLRVDTNLMVQQFLKEDRFKLWEELFPLQY